MITKEFIDLVAEMRESQRNWFNNHDYRELTKAKELEKRVDHILSCHREELKRQAGVQMTIFD